ncbi:hypothetical protein SALBM217S_08290 [Streptomyces griseoloalbus]
MGGAVHDFNDEERERREAHPRSRPSPTRQWQPISEPAPATAPAGEFARRNTIALLHAPVLRAGRDQQQPAPALFLAGHIAQVRDPFAALVDHLDTDEAVTEADDHEEPAAFRTAQRVTYGVGGQFADNQGGVIDRPLLGD